MPGIERTRGSSQLLQPGSAGSLAWVPGLVVYEKPTCSTCRRVVSLLSDRGIDFTRVNYFVQPLDEEQLQALLGKAALRPRDVVRMKEPGAAELALDDDAATLVEFGDRAVLARPPEKVLELL